MTNIIAVMATFPGRFSIAPTSIQTIVSQVDKMFVIVNEGAVPAELNSLDGVSTIVPGEDLKDTGKFFASTNDDDIILLVDDDIAYPPNYAERMVAKLQAYSRIEAVVGVHGIVYSDIFDGNPASRLVYMFDKELSEDCFVNQLGTGTVCCRGSQLPTFEQMKTSSRFVDVRFSVLCAQRGLPRVCIERAAGWLSQIPTNDSLFASFTTVWPKHVVREVQKIAGFRNLPRRSLLSQD